MGVGLKGHAYCNWRPHRATGDLPDRQTTCQISLRLTTPWFGFTHIQEKHSILSQRSLSPEGQRSSGSTPTLYQQSSHYSLNEYELAIAASPLAICDARKGRCIKPVP